MGFWGDIDGLLAPRTAKRLLGEHCDKDGKGGGDWWLDETNDKRSAEAPGVPERRISQ